MSGRISIIGGAGRVGSNAAYALQLAGIGDEIVLVDAADEAARGEALDLTHGRAVVGGPRFIAGGYDSVAGSDVVIVTAGLRRKPDESRLELIERNAALFREIVRSVCAVDLPSDAILLVVTNPVDILTYIAATEFDWPADRTIGLGTMLDTLRFRSLLGEELNLNPELIEGLILGEHGDSMVPIFSNLHYDGKALSDVAGDSTDAEQRAFARTRSAGAECISLKGGAGYAVGLAIRTVVHALIEDSHAVLPVSTVQDRGEFEGVAFSLPTRIGRAGRIEHSPTKLSQDEYRALVRSAEVLRTSISQLRNRGASA